MAGSCKRIWLQNDLRLSYMNDLPLSHWIILNFEVLFSNYAL